MEALIEEKVTDQEKVSRILHKATLLLTGKKIRKAETTEFDQTEEWITVGPSFGDLIMVIHEIGHHFAATPEERKLHNLGLSDELSQHSLNREVQGMEISKFLFKDWIMSNLSGIYQEYAIYVTEGAFSGVRNDYNDVEITEEWIMDRLNREGVNLSDLWKILYT